MIMNDWDNDLMPVALVESGVAIFSKESLQPSIDDRNKSSISCADTAACHDHWFV